MLHQRTETGERRLRGRITEDKNFQPSTMENPRHVNDDNLKNPILLLMSKNKDSHGETVLWSEEREIYFLELLAKRVNRDPNGAPVFKPSDWMHMSEKLFLKFGLSYCQIKLKGMYNRMRIMHTKFSELISHTGVTWNFETSKVEAHGDVLGAFTQV
ncbi:L10-interacting MYB domain-containing protein [Tanacetum coccineum]|uniref:L10-interacting MYB domain-containing protein n=1 Tax=Tanacetum coccineum TaxID=301880 RepID=A0ABQ5FSP9_9ASTR